MLKESIIPSRRFVLNLKIHGHTWKDTVHALMEFADHIKEHGETCGLVSGDGYVHITDKGKDYTQEKYETDLEEWRKNRVKD